MLTSAGVLAVGFGDIAQIEYRHTGAISVTGVNAPLPAVGVQLTVPIPEYAYVPKLGIAVHIGVPRDEQIGGATSPRRSPTSTSSCASGSRLADAARRAARVAVAPEHHRRRVAARSGSGAHARAADVGVRAARESDDARSSARSRGAAVHVDGDGAEKPAIAYGLLARFGLRWAIVPSVVLDGSLGYQLAKQNGVAGAGPRDVVQQWDIRLGAEVFVPWGALACRAVGVFCE